MKYKLLKQLRDAGFWQDYSSGPFIFPDQSISLRWREEKEMQDACYLPTLEGLIEACGEDFDALFSNHSSLTIEARHKWRADATNRTGYSVIGNSAKEAMARLWLALHIR